jgi:hypothetical protein
MGFLSKPTVTFKALLLETSTSLQRRNRDASNKKGGEKAYS